MPWVAVFRQDDLVRDIVGVPQSKVRAFLTQAVSRAPEAKIPIRPLFFAVASDL